MGAYDKRIVIEPAENGYIVTVESDEGTRTSVFTRRRQLMHYIGTCVDSLSAAEDDAE